MDPKITPHISYLLYRHDCVIVPGFGGFVANYQGARIHPTQHTFSPPSKHIAFNRSLQNNDGLLANRIAEAENISYPEANLSIAREIEGWNKELESTRRLDLEQIGVLHYDIEKNLRFEAETKVNYLLDSFGLIEVQSPAVKREGAFEKIAAESTAKKNTVKKPKLRFLSPTQWKVAAAIMALACLGEIGWLSYRSGYLPTSQQQLAMLNPFSDSSWMHPKKMDTVPVVKHEAESTQPIESQTAQSTTNEVALDTLQQVAESEVQETAIVTSTPATPEPAAASIETPAQAPASALSSAEPTLKQYLVVAGCFSVQSNAEKMLEMLRKKGYQASIAGITNKGLTMVIYKDFARRREAVVLLHEVKSKEDSTAWIFRN